MENVSRITGREEKESPWFHGEYHPQHDGSVYTGGSNVYSAWNTTQISFNEQVYHGHILTNVPQPPSEGLISHASDNSWQMIHQTEEMAQGEVQKDISSLVTSDMALDTSGSGGILDDYLLTILGTPPFTDMQRVGASGRVVDEYNVPFGPTLQGANETEISLSTTHQILPPNSPWNAARPLRVPQYNTGYVAFMNGPESPSDKSSYDELLEPGIQHSTTAFQPIQATEMDDVTLALPIISTTQHLKWQIEDPSARASAECLARISGEAASGRRGRRNGPLTKKSRQDANIVRKHGACIQCRFRKVKCSEGEVCDECRKHAHWKRTCIRSIVECYGNCYFPNVLTAHLHRGKVESLISENIAEFTDIRKTVGVTCGGIFGSMDVTVNIFINKTDELQFYRRLTTQDESEEPTVITEYSAHVGIFGMDEVLQLQCRSYINSMISNPYYVSQVTAGDPTEVCCNVLQIVHDYSLKEKDGLLDKAMQLHGIHFFMRTLITFTPESAAMLEKLDGAFRDVISPPKRYHSSRLLGREIKCFMHSIHKVNLKKVLKEFETKLKKQEATLWPIATNNFMSTETNVFDQSRPGYHECLELEKLPFAQMFHDAFGTHKKRTGHGNKSNFNPILNSAESQADWNQNAKDMVHRIREVIQNSYAEIRILSQREVFENNQFRLDYRGFLHDNPGRLLSKFLFSLTE